MSEFDIAVVCSRCVCFHKLRLGWSGGVTFLSFTEHNHKLSNFGQCAKTFSYSKGFEMVKWPVRCASK